MARKKKIDKKKEKDLELPNAIRDPATKAISIVDRNGLRAAKERKARAMRDIESRNELKDRMDSLEKKLEQILNLLTPPQPSN